MLLNYCFLNHFETLGNVPIVVFCTGFPSSSNNGHFKPKTFSTRKWSNYTAVRDYLLHHGITKAGKNAWHIADPH